MVEITKCPAGYAIGYIPYNGARLIHDMHEDTKNVSLPVSHMGYMQKKKKLSKYLSSYSIKLLT
jgi:hypothetical protein